MAGLDSNSQEQLSLQKDSCDARGSLDIQNGKRLYDKLIFQLCYWEIPCQSVQTVNDGHQQTRDINCVFTAISCSNGDGPSHPNKPTESNLEKRRASPNQAACVERTVASFPMISDETCAAAIHSDHENGVNCTPVLQTGDSIDSNRKGVKEPSFGSANDKTRDLHALKPGENRVRSMLGFGSTAPCCRHEQTVENTTCAVEGAGFCLENLSVINHYTQFGGGPGIDRDGAQVSGKFCGVGARYRVGKISPPDALREPCKTVEPASATKTLNLIGSGLSLDPVMSEKLALGKRTLSTALNRRLREMIGVLDMVKLCILPRVPGLAAELLHLMTEFAGSVLQFIDSGSLNDNVRDFKRSMAGVILNFDPNEFLNILKLSNEEVTATLPNTLKEWNEVLRNFLNVYVDMPNSRVPEAKWN